MFIQIAAYVCISYLDILPTHHVCILFMYVCMYGKWNIPTSYLCVAMFLGCIASKSINFVCKLCCISENFDSDDVCM